MPAAFADVSQLAADLHKASGQHTHDAAAGLIRSAASQIQSVAQEMAPKRTGALASSITVRFAGPLTAVIGPTEFYGVFQEFGTKGPYTIKPKRPDGYLVFEVNGTKVFARQVTHPGIRAHPFMRPATQQVIDNMTGDMADTGVQLIMEPSVTP